MNDASPDGTMSDPKKCPQCGATLPTGALDGLCPACLLQQGASKDSATQPAMPPFEPPPLAELARLFPQLEVLELIGKGGMGAVYKARQPSLDRFVALKILPPETVAGQGFGERFNREARALARLGHPNIVAVYDFGQAGGLHYFLMEFVDGVNLRQLQRAGRLSPREALQIVPQICDALQYAHDEGVVHRDIKPENVLVDRKGRVKIADFGLAKILGRDPADLRLTGEGQVMGTPHYMAPEQVEHPLEVDHRADIYSLGVVFYEMLTGELPLGRFAPPSRKVRVDVRLDEVVLHALEKEPEQRYQHASQVKTAVETIVNSGSAAAPAAPVSAPSSGTQRNKSPLARILEIVFDITFTSPLALKLINISALGFLGALAFLSFVPLPGMERCNGFSGFAGFFGLIGVAAIVEQRHRRRTLSSGRGTGGTKTITVKLPMVRATTLGLLVGLLILVVSMKFTLLQPDEYVSTARVTVKRPESERIGTPSQPDRHWLDRELAFIKSELVLGAVSKQLSLGAFSRLNLEETWSGRYEVRRGLSQAEIIAKLARQVEVRRVPHMDLIEISVFSRNDRQAADIANAIAQTYRSLNKGRKVEIIDPAEPGIRPVRPNRASNLAVAILLGLLTGGITTGGILLLANRRSKISEAIANGTRVVQRSDAGAHRREPWLQWALGTAALLLLVGLCVRLFVPNLFEVATDAVSSEISGADLTATGFGPVVETLLFDPDSEPHSNLLVFATGEVLDVPESWRTNRGVAVAIETFGHRADLMNYTSNQILLSLDMGISFIRSEEFDTLSASAVLGSVLRSSSSYFEVRYGSDTFVFQTTKANRKVRGIAQVTRVTTQPPAVKLRYKLAQATSTVMDRDVKQSLDSASAEKWSPLLTPGEKPDPSKIMEEANTLAAQGQFEEALQRQIWYHHHALEFNSAQAGVRLSFALSAWVELGRKFPKARQALVEIRDRKTRELAEGRGSFDLFHDIASINGYLQDEDSTFALFKMVQEKEPALAKQCFIVAEDLLVKKGEYALCLSFIPDPEAKFAGIRQSWENAQAFTRKNSMSVLPDHRKNFEDWFVTKTRQLIEILVGTGHKAEAEKIRQQALALLDDPRLKSAISDAEESVGRMRGQSRKDSTGSSRPPLLVSIYRDGLLRLGPEARLVSIGALREEFQTRASADTNLDLVITAAKDAPFQQMAMLKDMAKEMGIRSITVITQPTIADVEKKGNK